jgi:hypothetical protein
MGRGACATRSSVEFNSGLSVCAPFPLFSFSYQKKKTGGGGRSRGGQSQTHREIRFNMRGLERESRRGGRCFIELMGFEHDMGLWELGTGGRCWWCC